MPPTPRAAARHTRFELDTTVPPSPCAPSSTPAAGLHGSQQRASSQAAAYLCCCAVAAAAALQSPTTTSGAQAAALAAAAAAAALRHVLLLASAVAALSRGSALCSAVLLTAGCSDWLPGAVLLAVSACCSIRLPECASPSAHCHPCHGPLPHALACTLLSHPPAHTR